MRLGHLAIAISTYLRRVDELVGEGLRDRLETSEGGLTGGLADEVDGLVDSAEGRNIDSLSADDTTRSDTGGVFAGTAVGDGSDDDLDGVFTSEEVDQLHSLLYNSDCHLLFTVVSS